MPKLFTTSVLKCVCDFWQMFVSSWSHQIVDAQYCTVSDRKVRLGWGWGLGFFWYRFVLVFSERRKESLQTCMLILHILPVLDQGLVRLGAQKYFHRKFIYLLFLGKGNRKPYFHSFLPLIRCRRKNLEDSFYYVISSTGKFMTISNKTLFRFFFYAVHLIVRSLLLTRCIRVLIILVDLAGLFFQITEDF